MAKTTATCSLGHSETELQWCVNHFWSCILGNYGMVRILKYIPEPLTALIAKNTTCQKMNKDSKIIDIAKCRTCKNNLLAVEYTIIIGHYYQTAKTRAIYESIDGPADNPPNSDKLGNFN